MKIYIFFILLFTVKLCQAQSIEGAYRYLNEDFSEGRTITFSKGTFKEQRGSDLTIAVGGGVYTLKNHQLILRYQTVLAQDTSRYEITSEGRSTQSSSIELKVFDADGIPMVASYGCRDKNDKPINFVFTDEKGTGNMMIYDTSLISYFTIDYVGYHRIYIPIKNIKGKSVKITAYLLPQTKVYIEPQTKKYRVLTINDNQLVLSDYTNKFVFKKLNAVGNEK